jgi:hypothetical protein
MWSMALMPAGDGVLFEVPTGLRDQGLYVARLPFGAPSRP